MSPGNVSQGNVSQGNVTQEYDGATAQAARVLADRTQAGSFG